MLKRLKEKLEKAKREDKAAYQSMLISTILHATIAGALIYMGAEKIINEINLVEFTVEGDNLKAPKLDTVSNGKSEKSKNIASAPEPLKDSQSKGTDLKVKKTSTKATTPKRPQSKRERISKIAKTTEVKKAKRDKNMPSDPELRKIYEEELALKKQQEEFKKKMAAQKKEADRQRKIADAKRKLELKKEAFRLRQENLAKQEKIQKDLQENQKKLAVQKEKLKLQKIAQREYEQSRQRLLEKQQQLLAAENKLKSQQSNLNRQAARNKALADRQQQLALRQEAMRQKMAHDQEIARRQAAIDAKRRSVEAAEARARLQAQAASRAAAARRALQNQEAAIRIREGKIKRAESRYGVNLPEGARSGQDLKQRPGNPKIHYPAKARKNGWQGEGLVLYFVTNDGSVKNVQMVRSTGYPALDDAAVRTFRSYRFYPGQSGWTYNPVHFYLRSGNQNQTAGY